MLPRTIKLRITGQSVDEEAENVNFCVWYRREVVCEKMEASSTRNRKSKDGGNKAASKRNRITRHCPTGS